MGANDKKELTGVRAKLAAHKKEASGDDHVSYETLPKSKIDVAIPGFINHGKWMRAQRLAGNDTPKAQASFVAEAVTFEGEKLNVTDLTELCDAKDVLFLIGQIFGDDEEDEKALGNGLAIL